MTHYSQSSYKDSLLIVMGRSRGQVPQKACFGCVIQKTLKMKFTRLAVSAGWTRIHYFIVTDDIAAKLGVGM